MSRIPELKDARDAKIRKYYESLRAEKYKGVRKYTAEYCVVKVSEKFFLSPKYIEIIVYTSI